MSWDSYIDNLVAQSVDGSGKHNVDKACIIGIEGGAKWTTDAHANGLKLTTQEAAAIASCFKSKNFTGFQASGIHAETIKYQFLRVEDDKIIQAKKKDCGSLTMQASKTAIVIAHCPEGGQAGNCTKAVGIIAEYLESMNM